MPSSSQTTLLITMPWGPIHLPSLQLGLLQSCLDRERIAATGSYANVRFAAAIGVGVYQRIINANALRFLSEWLFNAMLSGGVETDPMQEREQFEQLIERASSVLARVGALSGEVDPAVAFGVSRDELWNIRKKLAPQFIDSEASREEISRSDIVGFSCTFNQIIPALALAKKIKERRPERSVIFGGSSCWDSMGVGLMNSFPWIDCCVLGEAEGTLPALVRALRGSDRRAQLAEVPNLCWRDGDRTVVNRAHRSPMSLEAVPLPNYVDYFKEIEANRKAGAAISVDGVCYETSRGCWWGGRNKRCRFCGLDKEKLPHRKKSPRAILAELQTLSSKYHVLRFHVADTLIPNSVLNQVFPAVADSDCDFNFICELRAGLSEEKFLRLASGGVRIAQIGIESFNTELLTLMGKGTTALQNIETLKWCAVHQVQAYYNLLWGVPGEKPAHYRAMNALLPSLVHLPPPKYPPSPVLLVRNSEYFLRPQDYTIRGIKPCADYELLYPDTRYLDFAYYFEYERPPEDLAQLRETAELVKRWNDRHRQTRKPVLEYQRGPDFVDIVDKRDTGTRVIRLEGATRDIFLFCDRIQSYSAIVEFATRTHPEPLSKEKLDEILEWLRSNCLIVREDDYLLNLPLRERR